jgi:hypothetical protein
MAMAAASLMAGCPGEVEPQAEADVEDSESVFDPLTDQVDKAKDVEAQVMQRKDDVDEALKDDEEN